MKGLWLEGENFDVSPKYALYSHKIIVQNALIFLFDN